MEAPSTLECVEYAQYLSDQLAYTARQKHLDKDESNTTAYIVFGIIFGIPAVMIAVVVIASAVFGACMFVAHTIACLFGCLVSEKDEDGNAVFSISLKNWKKCFNSLERTPDEQTEMTVV